MKKRFSEEQIIQAIRRLDSGESPKDLGRELGVHQQTIYVWKKKYNGMEVSDARKLRELEQENSKLKRLLANAMIDIDHLRALQSKNW
jgi:putative transposase